MQGVLAVTAAVDRHSSVHRPRAPPQHPGQAPWLSSEQLAGSTPSDHVCGGDGFGTQWKLTCHRPEAWLLWQGPGWRACEPGSRRWLGSEAGGSTPHLQLWPRGRPSAASLLRAAGSYIKGRGGDTPPQSDLPRRIYRISRVTAAPSVASRPGRAVTIQQAVGIQLHRPASRHPGCASAGGRGRGGGPGLAVPSPSRLGAAVP